MTKRAGEILRLMVEKRGHENGELVRESGEVWIGDQRTSCAVMNELLRLCMISLVHGKVGGYEVYTAASEAKEFLDDPKYVPLIVRATGRKR